MRRSLIVMVVGTLVLGLGLPPGPVHGEGTEVVADAVPSARADLEQAIAFRTDVHLDASVETVRRAAADAEGYPDMTWGVPLSIAEAAEILRRSQTMESLLPAVHAAQKDPSWAGWWLDHASGGVPVFHFAADIESKAASIAKKAPPSVR